MAPPIVCQSTKRLNSGPLAVRTPPTAKKKQRSPKVWFVFETSSFFACALPILCQAQKQSFRLWASGGTEKPGAKGEGPGAKGQGRSTRARLLALGGDQRPMAGREVPVHAGYLWGCGFGSPQRSGAGTNLPRRAMHSPAFRPLAGRGHARTACSSGQRSAPSPPRRNACHHLARGRAHDRSLGPNHPRATLDGLGFWNFFEFWVLDFELSIPPASPLPSKLAKSRDLRFHGRDVPTW